MTSIFVAKLDFGVTNEQLKEAFSAYGKVNKATIAIHKETGKSRGFAFVEMANPDEARAAISSLDGSKLNGRVIAVKEAEKREDNRSRPTGDQRSSHNHHSQNEERRPKQSFTKDPSSNTGTFIPPASTEVPKPDVKKKKEPEKKKTWDDDKGQKKPKMNAYKKSGKNSRFFEDDDGEDDWEDYLAFKKRSELDEEDGDDLD